MFRFFLLLLVLCVLFPVFSIIGASVEELVDHGNSVLNKGTKTLTLSMDTSVFYISGNCASICGGNASLKYSKTCSSAMPII